jgi:alkylation response protein AidB-like acyl-CoA dehydrogenase
MPGIELGDLGSKMGMAPKDNGYMIFDQVKVPRHV